MSGVKIDHHRPLKCLWTIDFKIAFLLVLVVSSEEWSKVGNTERGNLGITVADDGEFW